MIRILALILCCAVSWCSAATYHVATNGNDSADGSLATPWLTIGKSVSVAVAGDTVQVGQGIYNEFVTNSASGTAGNPIIFTGTRDSIGNWLTVIDPSTLITNSWTLAPEIGAGVWKQTNLAFTVCELTITNQRVPFVWTNGDMFGDLTSCYATTNHLGSWLLGLADPPTNLVTKINNSAVLTNFWDSVGALWCSTGSVCYLRLRSGASPDSVAVRIAPNSPNQANVIYPCVHIQDISYVIWSNFWMRGAIAGVFMYNANSFGNIVESNYFTGGAVGVYVGTHAHQNSIINNEINGNYYGLTNIGAWQDTGDINKGNVYLVSKFLMGSGSTYQDGIRLFTCGNSNLVSGNHMYGGMGSGIVVWSPNGNQIITNSTISGNVVEKQASVGFMWSEGQWLTQAFSNHVADCNLNMRFHHLDEDANPRSVYIYRNTFWEPDGIGDQIYAFYDPTPVAVQWPTFWTYHNSFSGGEAFFDLTASACITNGGATNVHFLNNIISDVPYAGSANYNLPFWTTTNGMMGIFDYNLLTPPYPTFPSSSPPAWRGSHNQTNSVIEWASSANMSYALLPGSKAIGNAIDTSVSFTPSEPWGTNTYPALPDGAAQVGGTWDIGALEFVPGVAKGNSIHVINAFFK